MIIDGLQKINKKHKAICWVGLLAIFVGLCMENSYATKVNVSKYNSTNGYNFVYFGGVPHGITYSGTDSASDESKKYVGDLTKINPEDENSAYKYAFTDKLLNNDVTKYAIRFRVLDNTSNDGIIPALFMLTEYAIGQRRWANGANNTQVWDNSEMKQWLNGEGVYEGRGVYNDCFNEAERSILEETITTQNTESTTWYANNRYACYNKNNTNLNKSNNLLLGKGNKIFLLSVAEVINGNYGFVNDASKICYLASNPNTTSYYSSNKDNAGAMSPAKDTTKKGSIWWLRSATSGYSSNVAPVSETGGHHYGYSGDLDKVVRFALNIPLTSIIYATPATTTPADLASLTSFKSMTSLTPSDTVHYKLTIMDKATARASFTTTEHSIITGVGKKIKVHYNNAQYSNVANTADHDCISAIIKDTTSDEATHYIYLKQCTTEDDASGELTIDIPDNITVGSYKLILMNERLRGAYQTNYAGCSTITLNIVENYPAACSIQDPVYSDDGSVYNFVYFGKVPHGATYSSDENATGTAKAYVGEAFTMYEENGVNKAPIRFRVLNTTSNGGNGNTTRVPALFMLTEYAVGQRRWQIDSGDYRQNWSQSEMKNWLNSASTYSADGANGVKATCFNDKEQIVIMPTTSG